MSFPTPIPMYLQIALIMLVAIGIKVVMARLLRSCRLWIQLVRAYRAGEREAAKVAYFEMWDQVRADSVRLQWQLLCSDIREKGLRFPYLRGKGPSGQP